MSVNVFCEDACEASFPPGQGWRDRGEKEREERYGLRLLVTENALHRTLGSRVHLLRGADVVLDELLAFFQFLHSRWKRARVICAENRVSDLANAVLAVSWHLLKREWHIDKRQRWRTSMVL